MDLAQIFKRVSIKNIAIIDDDLSTNISPKDIENIVGAEELNVFKDVQDPDCDSLIKLLIKKKLPHETVDNRVSSLSTLKIRQQAPDRIRSIAETVLSARRDMAQFVELIVQWLKLAGIKEKNIKKYGGPLDLDVSVERFDLVFIDYLLVNSSRDATLKLVKELASAHLDEQNPILFVLMSTHAEELSKDYSALRPILELPGSQFRILQKPRSNNKDDVIRWLHTFEQIAIERPLVRPITKFIQAWNNSLLKAVESITKHLWGLDAHALDILNRTAKEDHITLEEYFSEILSRVVIAEVEENAFPKDETKILSGSIEAISNSQLILSGAEIGDSRLALRTILSDVTGHREVWWGGAGKYPKKNIDKLVWIKRNIRFGTILHEPSTNAYLIHLTQPCDVAHVGIEDWANHHLLFMPGVAGAIDLAKDDSEKEYTSAAIRVNEQWVSIKWFLRRPRTPSMADFAKLVPNLEIVGQLRLDHAQAVLIKFTSLVARVGLPRFPRFTTLFGVVCIVEDVDGTHQWKSKTDEPIEFHLIHKNKSKYIQIDSLSIEALTTAVESSSDINKFVLNLIKGIEIPKTELNLEGIQVIFLGEQEFNNFSEIAKTKPLLDKINIYKPGKKGQKEVLFLWRNQ